MGNIAPLERGTACQGDHLHSYRPKELGKRHPSVGWQRELLAYTLPYLQQELKWEFVQRAALDVLVLLQPWFLHHKTPKSLVCVITFHVGF